MCPEPADRFGKLGKTYSAQPLLTVRAADSYQVTDFVLPIRIVSEWLIFL